MKRVRKWLIGNYVRSVILAFVVLIGAIGGSIWKNDWQYLQRSGSILVIIGGFLSARKYLRSNLLEIVDSETNINGGTAAKTNNELRDERELEDDIVAAKWGVGVLVAGTLIWGFGDLFGNIPI